jgi:phosphoenolpyruvate carboxykinase (ATP)
MQSFLTELGFKNLPQLSQTPAKASHKLNLFQDLTLSELVEHTIKSGFGRLSSDGALVVTTGKHTGRAAKDKYAVNDNVSGEKIWWSKDVQKMTPETFNKLKDLVVKHLDGEDTFNVTNVYTTERSIGSHPTYNHSIRLITPSPYHALFSCHLFRESVRPFREGQNKDFTILHAPGLSLDPAQFNTRSETVIVTDFTRRIVLIIGTFYAGEIKKSAFSLMNFIMPDHNILPIHAGSNVSATPAAKGGKEEVSVFFGLSGTGKTTLSTDEGKNLIGDDEHGVSSEGIFNFEGGCYAKTYKLSAATEPDIFKACTQYGALLENVVMDPKTRVVDFDDKSIAENGRGSYPLTFIEDFVPSSMGGAPKNLFFLSADAFGVLPPVSKLNRSQSMYYFLSGYTAKVAGTELGVVEPTAAFSTCFGGPFMTRKPEVYGHLLGELLEKLPMDVWLINTGWFGGGYGTGQRFPLKITRSIIRSIQDSGLKDVKFEKENFFGLEIPVSLNIPGVDNELLNPMNCWKDKESYKSAAQKLSQMFKQNFQTHYSHVSDVIKAGGPL